MSHTPPVPAGSQSPYPLQQPQSAGIDQARHELAETVTSNLKLGGDASGSSNRLPRLAAGAAIGSAAIVAALLFYNRSKTV